MQGLRHALQLTRFVLVWFALSVGVAVASPLVHPTAMDWVCTSTGAMKLVMSDADNSDGQLSSADRVTHHTLDCPLCTSIVAPPPALRTGLSQPSPLAYALQPTVAAHIASVTAPPLPSRGPPVLSC